MYDIVLSILFLLGMHMIADFPLQGDFLANNKGKYPYLLLVHSIIYATVMTIALCMTGIIYSNLVTVFTIILLTHVYIDEWKCKQEDKSKALTTDLYIDQALHIGINTLLYIAIR